MGRAGCFRRLCFDMFFWSEVGDGPKMNLRSTAVLCELLYLPPNQSFIRRIAASFRAPNVHPIYLDNTLYCIDIEKRRRTISLPISIAKCRVFHAQNDR